MQELIKQTQELVEYQKQEDSPEALATIPMLALKDINPKSEWWQVREMKIADVKTLHYAAFTNNVVYVDFYFDMRVLPQELIPYAALLSDVLAKLNTRNYSFGDLDKALSIHTGGFDVYLNTYLEELNDANLLPKFIVSSKAMNAKLDKLFELGGEIINSTIYNDKERLKAVLTRKQSRLDASIKRNGLGYARTRLASYFSNEGLFDEITNGAEYYWFITELVDNFDARAETIIQNLQKTAALLFSRQNMIVAVTCDDADMPVFSGGLKPFVANLPDAHRPTTAWNFHFEKKNEGLVTASKVQYVLQGWDIKQLGYEWNGVMRVLNQVLSQDYLQNTIRVVGGAYGGFSSFSPSGRAYFASYRDPNLRKTLQNYAATPAFLHDFDADEAEMTRFIIGAIARIDQPLTPSEKGGVAVRRYFEKTTHDKIQRDRDAMLATTAADIRAMEKMVSDILAQKAWCVYGNEEKLKSESDLFNKIVKLIQ